MNVVCQGNFTPQANIGKLDRNSVVGLGFGGRFGVHGCATS